MTLDDGSTGFGEVSFIIVLDIHMMSIVCSEYAIMNKLLKKLLYIGRQIAPLEIHEENLQDVEEQLRFLVHALEGATISYHLPLLRESFSVWMWRVIGVLVRYLVVIDHLKAIYPFRSLVEMVRK